MISTNDLIQTLIKSLTISKYICSIAHFLGFSGTLKTVKKAFSILTYSLLDYHPPVMFLQSWTIIPIIYTDEGAAAFRTFKLAAHLVRSDLI